MNTKLLWCLAIVVSALLSGCGGADADPAAPVPADAVGVLRSQLRVLAAAGTPASATEQLFDFAEAVYPSYFPGHKVTAASAPFAYRYYPETGIYLGLVVEADPNAVLNSVYVMGGPFGNAPALVGPMTDYLVGIKGSVTGYGPFASGLAVGLSFESAAGGGSASERLSVPPGSSRFEFPGLVPVGARYTVVVQTQPSAILNGGESTAPLVCTVSGGEGVASSAPPAVSIACERGYTIGGTVSWTAPPADPGSTSGMVLGSGGLTATPTIGAATFTLRPAVVGGTTYDVVVRNQPAGYQCAVAHGSGTVFGDVSDVKVSCVASVDLSTPASVADAGSFTRNEFTLNLLVKDFSVPEFTVDQIRDTFLAAYPAMAARFNPDAARSVTVVVDPDPAYPYPSYTLGTTITMSSAWLKQFPMDIDMVVHESFHIVQAYPAGLPTPSWITEGLADYARDRYGMWNAASGWALVAPSPSSSYTEGYRTTARFFKWLEANHGSLLLATLDGDMRAGRYSASFWTDRTGHTVDELWAEYIQFPDRGLQQARSAIAAI